MTRSHFTPYVVLIGSLVLLLVISLQSYASTISGKVVDEEGNPVPDIIIAIKSFNGKLLPGRQQMHIHEPVFPPPQPSNTDPSGAFSIENIVSPSVNKLTLLPERASDYEIRSIEMQGISFIIHPHQFQWREGFPFGIEEETDAIDVKITVRRRMWIRGQVLNADGIPLSNANVNLMVKSRSIDGSGRGRGSGGGTNTLDENGGFTRYVDSPAYYTVSVSYQGKSVESKELLLEKGQRLDNLTLTFKEKIQHPPKPNVGRPPVNMPPDQERMHAIFKLRSEGVWAINPANRHAYKRIQCQSPEEALTIAKAQNAHIVAINDKEEQQWILDVFGKENYWIGYTNDGREGDKQWDNGDPLTYTNWDLQNLISDTEKPPENEENTTKIYSVLIGVTGKWQRIRAENPVASIIERAILEKKDLIIGAPQPDTGLE